MKLPRKVQNLVADFRGLPRDYSTSLLKEEVPIGALFRGILKKYVEAADTRKSAKLLEYWPLIVGNLFAEIAQPHRVTARGVLLIKVQNSVIRQELSFQKAEILDRIRRICPETRISALSFSL